GSSRQNDRTTRSSAGYVSQRPIVGTTTTSMSCTTGCGGGRGWPCIRRAVRRPPTSPIADVRTGSVQTTEAYQSSELRPGWRSHAHNPTAKYATYTSKNDMKPGTQCLSARPYLNGPADPWPSGTAFSSGAVQPSLRPCPAHS